MFTQETVPQLKDVLQIWLGLFLMLQRVEVHMPQYAYPIAGYKLQTPV